MEREIRDKIVLPQLISKLEECLNFLQLFCNKAVETLRSKDIQKLSMTREYIIDAIKVIKKGL